MLDINQVKDFIKISHGSQKYGDKPYFFHLQMVSDISYDFIEEYVNEKNRNDVIISCWCHDLLEDTSVTFEELEKLTNSNVAKLVKSVTTCKGTRKERFSDKYYNGIKDTEYATFVKLCDRISNVEQSLINNKHELFLMYKNEHQHFKDMLYVEGEYQKMWNLLDNLISSI